MKADKIAKSFPTYQTSKARIQWVAKDLVVLSAFILSIENPTEEQSYDRFLFFFFTRQKEVFSKTLKISAPNSLFPKNDKNLLFNGGLFQQVLWTWNENLCDRSKKIEVEDRIQKTDGEGKETVFGLPGAMRSLRIFEGVVVDLVRRICEVGKGAQVDNLLFYWFFCASVDVGRFLCLNKYASGLRSTNLSRIRFNFSYERTLSQQFYCSKKQQDVKHFLQLKRSSLLNVYLR